MQRFTTRLGAMPYLIFGAGLFVVGLLALYHITSNIWPYDPQQRLDLTRALALDQASSTMLLEAADVEWIFSFLAVVLVSVTGLTLPLVYVLNKRFGKKADHYLIVLRQSMWIGFWVAFCVWLQMQRALTVAAVLLLAGVLLLFELLLQLRGQVVREVKRFREGEA